MTIILDFDGTLADTRSIIVGTMQQTLRALNLPSRTDAQCAAMIGLPLKETFTRLLDVDDAMGEKCAAVYTRFFFENNQPGAVPVFPHVVETLHALHQQGHRLTIASSRSRASLEGFLADMHLQTLISYVVSANEVTHAKPHPEPVLKTLEAFGIAADDAIVVGDTTYDIAMGQRAGCKTVAVTYGNQSRSELLQQSPDYIIDRFDHLLQLV